MASSTPSAEPRQIARPVSREGRLYCPRCDARLQFDCEEYVCLVCGYEYLPDPEELRDLRQGRRPAGWGRASLSSRSALVDSGASSGGAPGKPPPDRESGPKVIDASRRTPHER